jgi:hypothetical protein
MNINNSKKKYAENRVKPLFEAEQEQIGFEQLPASFKNNKQVNAQKLQTVLVVKSKQFVFDCGAIMGAIKYDTGNMFGLSYHADKSSTVDEFIDSVKKFIATSGETVTANDEARLRKEYEKIN